MNKKKVLGTDPLSWIRLTNEGNENEEEPKKSENKPNDDTENYVEGDLETGLGAPSHVSNTPKFETYPVKLTLRLRDDQLEFLARIERQIMKNRSRPNRRERITKNSIIRALIDSVRGIDNIEMSEIGDEAELVGRLMQAVRSKAQN